MVGYAERRTLREPPSEDQRKFLETLRDSGDPGHRLPPVRPGPF